MAILQELQMNTENNIVLIGMPAVGKSTVGILLAKRIGYHFIDTDILIQTGEGTTLAKIIEQKGVKRFLEIEADYMCSLECNQHVIATGGSAVYSKKSMVHLAENSLVVYLDIELKHLKKRLSELDSRGVIRGRGQEIDSLYSERRPLYKKYADITIDCGTLTADKVLTRVLGNINQESFPESPSHTHV